MLGILVASDRHGEHLINICQAAARQGKKLLIFFSHRGVLLTRDPRLSEFSPQAEMRACQTSLKVFNLDRETHPVEPANQAWHTRLIERADRYITL